MRMQEYFQCSCAWVNYLSVYQFHKNNVEFVVSDSLEPGLVLEVATVSQMCGIPLRQHNNVLSIIIMM